MSVSVFANQLLKLRLQRGLSQTDFYTRYGIPLRVGKAWEQSGVRKKPDAAATVLVMLIEESPDTIAEIYRKAIETRARRRAFSKQSLQTKGGAI